MPSDKPPKDSARLKIGADRRPFDLEQPAIQVVVLLDTRTLVAHYFLIIAATLSANLMWQGLLILLKYL